MPKLSGDPDRDQSGHQRQPEQSLLSGGQFRQQQCRLSGLAIALASGASTAWLMELEPRGDRMRATRIAIGANLLGLGMGPLLAGLLAEFARSPLQLPYVVYLLLLAPVAWSIYHAHETVREGKSFEQVSLRPRLGVPREVRVPFLGAAIGAFAVFAVLGFYTALIPGLLQRVLQQPSHAVAGAVVAEIFFIGTAAMSSMSRWQHRPERYRMDLMLSLLLLVPGIALLVAAQRWHSMPLLLIATAIGGMATGPGYQCSLGMINEIAPADRRSETVSTYLIACYAGISLPVIGIGLLAKLSGPLLADEMFAGLIIATALLALLALIRTGGSGDSSERP